MDLLLSPSRDILMNQLKKENVYQVQPAGLRIARVNKDTIHYSCMYLLRPEILLSVHNNMSWPGTGYF